MKIAGGECRLPAELRGGAMALGNFDGVHRGHQAVIGQAIAMARKAGRPALVATFDPHPSRFFRPETPPFAITSAEQKLRLFAGLGLDGAVVIPFNAALAGLAAEEFAREWLHNRLGVSHLVTGEDFTFGKGRTGSPALLRELGKNLGFTAEAISPIRSAGDMVDTGDGVISSTRIRKALVEGDMPLAQRLLSRPFAIKAEVVHGQKLGRTIGVPTINQRLGDYVRPRYGVYAVRVNLPDGNVRNGVANIGIRPMFDPPQELLETWILDWSGDLYGQSPEVELIAWLRPELKLSGLEALQAQIAQDAEDARRILSKIPEKIS